MPEQNIFLPQEQSIFITEPVADDKARIASAQRRSAAFFAMASGAEGADVDYKIADVEHEILTTGTSKELDNMKSFLSETSNEAARQQFTELLSSDRPVAEIVSSLRAIRDAAPPVTIEDLYVEQEQRKDSRYIAPIMATMERDRSGGFLYKEEVDADPLFAEAAKQLYPKKERKEFSGDDIEAVEYGRKLIRELTNPTSMVATPFLLDDEDDALAFMYLLTTMDAQEYTVGGFFKNIAAMASDPVNLLSTAMTVGLAPLATKLAGKKLISESLKKTLIDIDKRLASRKFLASEGAVYGSTMNLTQQNVEKQSGFRQKISATEAAVGGAIGGVVGFAAPSVPSALAGSADYITSKTKAWYNKIPPAEKMRQTSPTAGRKVTTSNITTPSSVAGEAPEESFNALTPKGAVKAGPSATSEWERLVDQYPALVKHLDEADVNSAKQSLLARYVTLAQSGGRVVRADKSTVAIEGDKFVTSVAIGQSEDVGYTRLHDVSKQVAEIKDKVPLNYDIGVFVRQSNTSQEFREITDKAEFSKIINSEVGNNTPSGEYFIAMKFTDYVEDSQKLAGLWYDEMLGGFDSGLTSFLSYGAQRGVKFYEPYSYLANAQSKIKQILEYPLVELKTLKPDTQVGVLKAIREAENKGFMSSSEALVHFSGDKEASSAYVGIAGLSDVFHRLYDAPLVKQARKDGFWQYTFKDLKGDASILAKEVESDFLLGHKEGVDLVTGNVITTDKIRSGLKKGELKLVQLYSPVSKGKAVYNIGVVPAETKLTKSVITAVLSKRAGYIPGVRKSAYKVVEISDNHTYNGNKVDGNSFLETDEGQKTLTVALANSAADAELWVTKQDNPSLYRVVHTKETSSLQTHIDFGYPVNSKGVIYGSRSEQQIQTIHGAGELADVFSSLEYASSRLSVMMTENRLSRFHESKWLNSFGKPGKEYPRNKEDLKAMLGGTHLSAKQQVKAEKAWRSIEAQRRFREDQMSRMFDKAMLTLSDYSGKMKLTPLARILGKQVATGKPVTQSLTTFAFYNQIVLGLNQQLLNVASAGQNALFTLGANPTVFPRVVRDFKNAMTGKDTLLINQLRKSGLLSSINQHDLQQYVIPLVSREKEIKASVYNTLKTNAKAALGRVKQATFDTPEQINKAAAFISQRQLYAAEKGKKVTELTDTDLATIVSRADVLTGSMSGAGRIPISGIPPFNLLLQYAGYTYKMGTVVMSGVPGLEKLPMSQKVVPAKYVRRALLTYLGAFGFAGIGSDSGYERFRSSFGIEDKSKLDYFLRNGVFGASMNYAMNALDDAMFSDDDKEMDLAWSQRLSNVSDSGLDLFLKPWDFVMDSILGDDDPLQALAKFPVAGLAGQTRDAYNFMTALYGAGFQEELATDEKAAMAFQEMVKLTSSGGRNTSKAWLAYNTGLLYDSVGRENIGGVSKMAALAQIFSVQPVDLLQMYETNRVLTDIADKGGFSESEIEEVARDHFNTIEKVIRQASANGYTFNDSLARLRASKTILEMSVPPHQKVQVYNAYLRLANGEVGRSRMERVVQTVSAMITKETYSPDLIEAIRAMPEGAGITAEQKEIWITGIERRLQADSDLVDALKEKKQ